MYVLSLNYEGDDYQVEVPDIETANLLLNDAVAAKEYVQNMLGTGLTSSQVIENESLDVLIGQPITDSEPLIEPFKNPNPAEFQYPESQELLVLPRLSLNTNESIWTRKKPTERDNEATALMLAMREKFSSLFDDKKSRKVKLWNDIAKNLKEKNFSLGEKGGERCRQKFANLQKAYLAYIRHQTTTGAERNDDIPPFFEKLHSILGSKHKVTPINLEDSMDIVDDNNTNNMDVTQNETRNNTDPETEGDLRQKDSEDIPQRSQSSLPHTSCVPSTSTVPITSPATPVSQRFKNANRKVSVSRQDDLIREIQKDREIRNQEFSFLKMHLKKSEQQKDRFLNIMELAFGVKKRNDSSDSD